jgi:hypothetical protein
MSVGDPPLEIRVHGVGGPQGGKMLGELDESDIVTLPPFGPEGKRLPKDLESRFVRRVPDDDTEAYEWGGLTTGSWGKALWILYLPLTLLNVAGWAHHEPRDSSPRQWALRTHLSMAHALALLGTVTYVLWIGYLLLDLVAVRWRDHVLGFAEFDGWAETAVDRVLPFAAPVVFLLVIVALALVPVKKGRFEEVGGADDSPWPNVPALSSRAFFARARSHGRLRKWHAGVGAVVAVAVVAQYFAGRYAGGWHRIGLALMIVAGAQGALLLVLVVVDGVGRWRQRRRQDPMPSAVTAPGLWPESSGPARWITSWIPVGAALAVLGTVIAHSAFAGTAMLLRPWLASFPEKDPPTVLKVGPELGAADVLSWVLAITVALSGALAIYCLLFVRNREQQGLVVKVARRAHLFGLIVLVAVIVPVAVYVWLNIAGLAFGTNPSQWWSGFVKWYDQYRFDSDAILQRVGAFVLAALPPIVFAILRGSYDSGPARVVGNAWDVFTFWPRRFHPYAAPPSGERSVPELRARIEHTLGAGKPVVIAAHSQGSVLAAAAIASTEPDPRGSVRLVTFGSPLGVLYSPTWPAYVSPMIEVVDDRVKAGKPWVSFWRATDPIGAGVPRAHNTELDDPQHPTNADLDDAVGRLPLERPPPWGTRAAHSYYLTDRAVRHAIEERRR